MTLAADFPAPDTQSQPNPPVERVAPPPRPLGYGRPPAGRPFRPGVSGNPLGRPRRAALAPGGRGRVVTAQPTELELALTEPILCMMVDPSEPVARARAVVARLTQRALDTGDVAACRELLRLIAEADALAAERALLAEQAQEAHEAAVEAAALEAERRDREQAEMELEDAAERAAEDAGQDDMDDDDRALALLDAVDIEDGRVAAVRPWVVEAAQAHDPSLPRAGDIRPIDLAGDPADALDRLGVLAGLELDEQTLTGWFIDAARARRPDLALTPGDEALLQLVRGRDNGEHPDWTARRAEWKRLVAAKAAPAGAARPGAKGRGQGAGAGP